MENIVGVLVVFFIIGFGVFLLLRELMCWYYKINRIVSLLESIDSKLVPSGRGLTADGNTVPFVSSDKESCPFCKEPSLKANKTCEVCGRQKR